MGCPRDNKICTAADAVARIEDGTTVASGGFIGAAHAEALTAAIERRFKTDHRPRDLTLMYAAGQGDGGQRGLNHLAHEGLVRRVIGGHWGLAPRLGQLALQGKIDGYVFPQGVMCHLFRDIAAGRPGCITRVGIETFIDPIHTGGRVHPDSPDGLVDRVELGGETYLWYKAIPIDVALIRATAADPLANLVMDREAIIGEVLPLAQAAHNSGGIVIAQVEQLLDSPAPPMQVRVPGILVNHVVVAGPHEHEQTFAEPFNPVYCSPGDASGSDFEFEPMAMDARQIIAARACDEVPTGAIANLGIGMPEGIARIASQRGNLHEFTLTVESGPIGGIPAGGLSFGAAAHPHAIIDQPAQFDFYDGRGLDFAALGAAQIDSDGNVNVSKFGDRLAGVGGFVNITQSARNLVFCGTFTAGGLEVRVEAGRLHIITEGRTAKFVDRVEQLSYSGTHARKIGQRVLYVTERAVFQLVNEGLELIEIAPGIDLETQVLALMAFRPTMGNVKPMPAHVFVPCDSRMK